MNDIPSSDYEEPLVLDATEVADAEETPDVMEHVDVPDLSELHSTSALLSPWVLRLLVLIFGFTLLLQVIDLWERAHVNEVAIRNDAMIGQIDQVKNDFEKQASGWDSLVTSHQKKLDTLQSDEAASAARIKVLGAQKTLAVSEAADTSQQLDSMLAQLKDARLKLKTAEGEFDVLSVRKASTEKLIIEADTKLVTAQTARDAMLKDRDRLTTELAAQKETQRLQTEKIEENQRQIRGLELKMSQLANLDLEIKTKENISADLKKDVLRLTARQTELKTEIMGLESKSKQSDQDVKTKQKAAAALLKEVERLTAKREELKAEIAEMESEASQDDEKTVENEGATE
jgi:chromosome segregation ATPase